MRYLLGERALELSVLLSLLIDDLLLAELQVEVLTRHRLSLHVRFSYSRDLTELFFVGALEASALVNVTILLGYLTVDDQVI